MAISSWAAGPSSVLPLARVCLSAASLEREESGRKQKRKSDGGVSLAGQWLWGGVVYLVAKCHRLAPVATCP